MDDIDDADHIEQVRRGGPRGGGVKVFKAQNSANLAQTRRGGAGGLDGGRGRVEANAEGNLPILREEHEEEAAAAANIEDGGARKNMRKEMFERRDIGAIVLEEAEEQRAAGVGGFGQGGKGLGGVRGQDETRERMNRRHVEGESGGLESA